MTNASTSPVCLEPEFTFFSKASNNAGSIASSWRTGCGVSSVGGGGAACTVWFMPNKSTHTNKIVINQYHFRIRIYPFLVNGQKPAILFA